MKNPQPSVADYMTTTPQSIGADQPIARARSMMREHHIRHLPVLQAGRLVGILTDRDLAWVESFDDERRSAILVDDAMTPYPYVATPSTPLAEVARNMAKGKYGAALVAEGDHVLGVFTTTDAMRALAEALDVKDVAPRTRRPRRVA